MKVKAKASIRKLKDLKDTIKLKQKELDTLKDKLALECDHPDHYVVSCKFLETNSYNCLICGKLWEA